MKTLGVAANWVWSSPLPIHSCNRARHRLLSMQVLAADATQQMAQLLALEYLLATQMRERVKEVRCCEGGAIPTPIITCHPRTPPSTPA